MIIIESGVDHLASSACVKVDQQSAVPARPLLKWAGGKTQLLNDILPKVPLRYGRFIEPFLGGGALFFALNQTNSVIADSNLELINI